MKLFSLIFLVSCFAVSANAEFSESAKALDSTSSSKIVASGVLPFRKGTTRERALRIFAKYLYYRADAMRGKNNGCAADEAAILLGKPQASQSSILIGRYMQTVGYNFSGYAYFKCVRLQPGQHQSLPSLVDPEILWN